MLRLTLRTLLAYLDDTLDPAQAKDMGRRVAESEVAQETMERIKSVTRRRRLTAPALDPEDSRADPNTIAEYLDNALDAEAVAELEQAALKSDVLLAEVAASHQILTLVLGEPAKVPPTARQRMYSLVKGPEAVPNRKPSNVIPPVSGVPLPPQDKIFADEIHDDTVLTKSGNKPLLIGGFIGILLALVVAVWLAIPTPPETGNGQGYVAFAPAPAAPAVPTPKVADPKIPDAKTPANGDPKTPGNVPPEPRVVTNVTMPPAPMDASAERKPVGVYDSPKQPLLHRQQNSPRWEIVKTDDLRLSSTDTMMALPGFHPSIKLDNGIEVQLWGNVPELLNVPVLESRVTFYQPPEGFDADLTLHSGRLFVRALDAKRGVKIRVRFLEEVWNVTLADAKTEIAFDRWGESSKGTIFDAVVLESPRTLVYMGVLSGEATVQVGLTNSGALPSGTRYKWDSKGGRAAIAPMNDPDEALLADRWATRTPSTPAAKEVELAVTEWTTRISQINGSIDLEMEKAVRDSKFSTGQRILAARYLQSTDNVYGLLDAAELESGPVRDAVVRALRHWCSQAPDREKAFGALLIERKNYTDEQRPLIQALLRSRVDTAPRTVEQLFTLLRHERLIIRELARMQLAQIDPTSAEEAGYEAAAEPSRRMDQIMKWQSIFGKK